MSHEEKGQLVSGHFWETLKGAGPRLLDFNWDELSLELSSLQGIEATISKEEVVSTISKMSGDKAPGLDGFTGLSLSIVGK